MRLTLKHQILLAPATVLLLMSLLLGFLQYTYWDLSVKRQQAQNLKTSFIALAEAEMATKGMLARAAHSKSLTAPDAQSLEQMNDLYAHLESAVARAITSIPPAPEERDQIRQAVKELNPERGYDSDGVIAALTRLRPLLESLALTTQKEREQLRELHNHDMEEIVARTAFVSIVVLGAAILLGVFLSLTFAHRILRRIQLLSAGAARIAKGDLVPVAAPPHSADELDDLGSSINRMTEQLIRVVSTEKLLEGAEEERRRIAMDIHDQTMADLSSVLRGLQELRSKESCLVAPPAGTEPCKVAAAVLEEEMRRAMANLREVMDDLHPQTLDILGLGAALQSHMDRHFGGAGMPDCEFYISPEVERHPLPRLTQVTLYRITIEAMHNVCKHAHASRFEVLLAIRGKDLVLSVEDNGDGISPGSGQPTQGRGLNNIRERARAIGATVQWGSSRFTSGTRFELVLPLHAAVEE